MIEGIAKIIGTEVLKTITSNTLKRIKPEMFNSEKDAMTKFKENFAKHYETHFKEVCKWAGTIPFIGLAKPKDTRSSTIELIIATNIVSYNDDGAGRIDEKQILNSKNHILLLGSPGAGKTTTLKRLVISYIMDFSNWENAGFPILIRLRDIPPEQTLLKYILNIFSIHYEDKMVSVLKTIKKRKTSSELKEERKLMEQKSKKSGKPYDESAIELFYFETVTEQKLLTTVGSTPIEIFLSHFLNENKCFLILDGFDELHESLKPDTLKSVKELGLRLDRAKILMTVRKSELNKIIDNFLIYEVANLNSNQIKQIASKWLANSDAFVIELEKKPYRDLANRPIFLTFLLILFEKYSTLPTQPSEVYEDTTYLIVKEWDEHRDIERPSKYGDFNTRKKIKFISELSYYLTYKIRQKVFSSKDLILIYEQISKKYGLPEDDSKAVVLEIESHTGLIVESTYKNFEFSHLSIQEFLCAKHLVHLPYSKETINYFFEYPEPLAIAVCISGEPSTWFTNLILNSSLNINNFRNRAENYSSAIYTILTRLLVETPSFKRSDELGLSFFYLITNFHINENFTHLLDEWFDYPEIQESLASVLKGCKYARTIKNCVVVTKTAPTETNYFIKIPNNGEFPNRYIKVLEDKGLVVLNKHNFID